MATRCSVPEVSTEIGESVVKRGTIGGSEYILVDDESQIEPALSKLREAGDHPSPIAVDCEGENLSRRGRLSIVSVSTEDRTFLFDIKKLGDKVFHKGLKEILEDPDREKLMFDCREDSDCLRHRHWVILANVIDLQLLQVIYRETHPEGERGGYRSDQTRVRGLLFCLQHYVKDIDLIRAKQVGEFLIDKWMERPLSEMQLKYAAADVKAFFKLYDELKVCVESSSAKGRLRQASQRYLGFHRDRPCRSYDDYEQNSYLPWRLVPDYAGSSYKEQKECVGCERSFPRSDFSKNQLHLGTQKCPVCKKVKGALDRQARYDRYHHSDDGAGYDSDEWC